ncbi:MAG: PAS domain S-box protein [Geobacteraceae bacterium]|nr:PAS domain S-box protein [Geobacteraceae bacterium]
MFKPRRAPIFIASLYALLGAVWIYYSDSMVGILAHNKSQMAAWSMYKGLAYVIVTSALLFWLVRRHTVKLLSAQNALESENKECMLARSSLAQSEEQFRQMFEKHRAIMYLVDTETLSVYGTNEAARRFYGYSPREFEHLKLNDLSIQSENEIRNGLHDLSDQVNNYYVSRHRLRNGDVREVEIYCTPIILRGRQFFFSIVHDISERIKAQEALRISEDNYRTIFDSVTDAIFVHDMETGRILEINSMACEMFGYTRDDFPMLSPEMTSAMYSPFDHEEALHRVHEAAAGTLQCFEWKARHRDGHVFMVEVNLKKVALKGENRLLAVVRDITESKQTEDALRESEARFRSLVEATSDWIWEVDSNFRFTYASPKVNDLLGFKPAEIIGKTLFDFILEEDREKTREIVTAARDARRPFPAVTSRNLHRNGRIIVLETGGVPIFDAIGGLIGYRGIVRNITDRKHLEEQLLQAQKMEAIGQLAGGIAHDFNNILTAITGYVFLLGMKVENEELKKHVDQIRLASERAAALTDSLLAFSRKQIICLQPLSINTVLKKAEKFLSRLIREDIEIRMELCPEELIILGDETKLEQIVINLVTNARDAMPRGGILTISTEHKHMDMELQPSTAIDKEMDYLLLSVSDTGVGIDERTRDRIFEPFFTTKEVGKGTGLGLAIVYEIIRQLNGYVDITSEQGLGTSIGIYLPLVQESSKESAYIQLATPERGAETILIAEDDPDARRFIKTVLEEFGYTVIEAFDGKDVVEKFTNNSERIQCVILDIIMPKQSGKDAHNEIIKIRPDVKTLFLSGYTGEFLSGEGILEEGLHFLPKPVAPWLLLEKVRELLHNRS